METYVLGDIHGGVRALEQVLESSPFRPGIDRLIQLGDVSDGWPDTPACVERLLSIPNSIWLQGNHDWWTAEWLATAAPLAHINLSWYAQGGKATYEAYQQLASQERRRHFREFFQRQQPYFVDEANNLYVHAGYNPDRPIEVQDPYDLIWTRRLWREQLAAKTYGECFIGHTPTWPASSTPVQQGNVWNLDQGAAYGGPLTMMNVRTKEYVQSDAVRELYPGVKGRSAELH
ncbi:metallophosphoesterase family protein [Hymenobacter saemangeumensis]|uniref:Metallophosphoesterase family protein n=1 Tax=Hymenobacter saemangeumensis TaxID=1084522 RepID=A0ABP8HZT7_9BACT